MDVVYKYGGVRPGDLELRYSLRSLQNVPHDNVWIVGEPPSWTTAYTIEVTQNKGSKWANAVENIRVACTNPDVSADFIMMDDDFFILHPIEEIPVWHRGSLQDEIKRLKSRAGMGNYGFGLVETAELLRWAQVPEPMYAYNLHVPTVLNKERVLECFDFVKSLRPHKMPQCFLFRTFYGNYWQTGGEQHADCKIYGDQAKPPSGPFLSTVDSIFAPRRNSRVRQHIDKLFPRPSPYER